MIINTQLVLKPIQPLVFGHTIGRYPQRYFGLLPEDQLLHTFVIGQTGTGKSTLLFNILKQNIENGHGAALIDPHGDLAIKAVDAIGAMPHIYWDAAASDNPYGYNPLTRVSAAYRPLVASALIDTLKKQWADAWGPRMEHLLRYTLLALLEYPATTIADIMPMLLDEAYQQRVTACITDLYVKRFWTSEFKTMKYKGAIDGVAPIANKLGAFLAHPTVRKALCEPEKPLRFRQIIDSGTILIVNLAKGRLGADTANVLGGMILSNLSHAALSRQNIAEHERKKYFAIVDEFPSFTTAAFGDILSELRKYKLGLSIATQHRSQIDNNVFDAILGNVGSIISFRVGANDAPILSKQFGADVPSARDLVGLSNYEFYAKLMINGEQSKPFSAKTISPYQLIHSHKNA